jgi:hypothetical protein
MKSFVWLLFLTIALAGCKSEDTVGSGSSLDGGDQNDNLPTTSDICNKLIECARATGQAGVTTLIAMYGEDGECWSLANVEESDCWTECRAAMEAFRLASPDEPACLECTDPSECAAFGQAYCDLEGECSDSICGNGELEGSEICDGHYNCEDDCTFDGFECNPVNDPLPCASGQKCEMTYDASYYEFGSTCETAGAGGLYENCDSAPCQVGYACVVGSRIGSCPNGGPKCCTPWCDLSALRPDCPDQMGCHSIAAEFVVGADENVFDIGYCGNSK